MRMARRRFVSVEEALARLRNMIGQIPDWATLQSFLPPDMDDPFTMRSAIASTFNASLEMAKQGLIDLKQVQSFGPIYIRRHSRSEEHTSELQSLMRISYAVFCLNKKKNTYKQK